jgi:CheY-like chemotaxis protein
VKHLLVLEVDAERRRGLAEALTWAGYASWAGYTIDGVATAAEALEHLRQVRPEALLVGSAPADARDWALIDRCLADGLPLAFAPCDALELDEGRRTARRAAALLLSMRRVTPGRAQGAGAGPGHVGRFVAALARLQVRFRSQVAHASDG